MNYSGIIIIGKKYFEIINVHHKANLCYSSETTTYIYTQIVHRSINNDLFYFHIYFADAIFMEMG